MQYYIDCMTRKYATFGGRARRREYWMFAVFNFLFSIVALVIDAILGTAGLINGIYTLAVIIPSWAVFFRRLHDTGHSGWWWLIGFVPIIGGIVLFVWMCSDSEFGDNAYGPNPKG